MRKALLIVTCAIGLSVSYIHAAVPATVVDAAMTGNRDVVKTLLQNGADVNTALADGMRSGRGVKRSSSNSSAKRSMRR